MNLTKRLTGFRPAGKVVGWIAAGLDAPAVTNHLAARRAEHRHPPEGSFIEVDGVRLNYNRPRHKKPARLGPRLTTATPTRRITAPGCAPLRGHLTPHLK
jgi:hypothetical protein